MKILVTGVRGQLGYEVSRELKRRNMEYVGLNSAEMDITDRQAVDRCFHEYGPDAVIHCAGYTKVDQAEDEPEKCRRVNTDGTRNIARACREADAKMIYISTDYVFSGAGTQAYRPDDPTGPLSVYGETKLGGELAVRELLERFFIVRVSWLFGKNGVNFVRTMLRLAESRTEVSVVNDQIGSPTYAADLAKLLCDMIGTEKYGIYHASNEGLCSWAEFAETIFLLAGKNITVHPIPTSEYPAKAMRPLNSRLDKSRLEEMGFCRLPHWKDALERYLEELSAKV